ncbi:hypothetical protein P5673_020533 [Acropora cervicornis]|uniref:Uncharacterized protein n=1 Tax=Acropora cervicornis TaxID=6130 RepID=A0AAD9Q9Z0_ACRCE|nr:hypothetical protein P5673_020533 [Acropora cervicornis]
MAEPVGDLPPSPPAPEPPAPEPPAEPLPGPAAEPVVEPDQANDRLKLLEDELKALEEKQGANTLSAALSSVRNALQKPGTVYDPSEASAHVEALVRAARSVAHEKVDYYAAILDELKGRSSSLSSSAHQRLLLGLLGDPTRAKVAKESSVVSAP